MNTEKIRNVYHAMEKEINLISDVLDLIRLKSSEVSRLYVMMEKEYSNRRDILNSFRIKHYETLEDTK